MKLEQLADSGGEIGEINNGVDEEAVHLTGLWGTADKKGLEPLTSSHFADMAPLSLYKQHFECRSLILRVYFSFLAN